MILDPAHVGLEKRPSNASEELLVVVRHDNYVLFYAEIVQILRCWVDFAVFVWLFCLGVVLLLVLEKIAGTDDGGTTRPFDFFRFLVISRTIVYAVPLQDSNLNFTTSWI